MRNSLFLTALVLFTLAGCNFSNPEGGLTPTVEAIVSPSPLATLEPSPEATSTPTVTPSPEQATISAAPTETMAPPTETLPPIATEGPYIHIIQENETLGYIIQLYGYTTFDVIAEVVQINDNIPNADTLPGPGSEIKIPRQTATPQPTTASGETQTSNATAETLTSNNVGEQLGCYTVEEGDTLVGIMEDYNTTLEILAQLNRDLDWFNCDFRNPSGGPNCNPGIQVGQCINVPLPTATPSLTPTPSGNETPTPTPTYMAPRMVYPAEGAVVPAGPLTLQWVSAGVLTGDQQYLVEVTDTITNEVLRRVGKETSLTIPDSMIPADGQVHLVNWRVSVASPNEQGVFRIISGPGEIRTFQWQSR